MPTITLTFDQAGAGIPAGSVDRGRTDIKSTGAIAATRAYPVTITIGNIPPTSTIDVLLLDEPPNSNPLLTQLSSETWTLEFDVGCWGPFRVRVTATINDAVVASVTRRISIRSPGYHIAYPALSERTDPNATAVPTTPSVEITEMNEGSTNRPIVDFHRELVEALEGTSGGGGGVIPDGSITEDKLAPELSDNLLRADGSIPFTGSQDAAGHTIANLGAPVAAGDAVPLGTLLAAVNRAGTRSPCRLVATTPVTASNTQVIDTKSTVNADRVLLTAQASPADNGIYVASDAGAWVRAVDADATAELLPGMVVFVTDGAEYAESGWILATDPPLALGTSALTFTRFTGAAQLVAGAGLVKTGNVVDVVGHADGSIVASADAVQVGTLAADAQHGARGGGSQHAAATPAVAGFLSAADKTRLDGMATGAAALASSAPANVGAAAAVGVGTTAARADHVHSHGAQTDGAQHAAATTAVAGFLSTSDKTRLDSMATDAAALTSTAPPAVAFSSAVGAGTTAARGDHTHAHGAQTDGTLHAAASTTVAGFISAADKTRLDGMATGAAALTNTTPASVGATTAVVGVGTAAARDDHTHAVLVSTAVTLGIGGANSAGSGTGLARANHVHQLPALATTSVDGFMAATDKTRLDGMATGAAALTSTAPVNVDSGASAVGVATTAARQDHKHTVSINAPIALAIGGANVQGSNASLARSDHQHAMPALATTSVDGFMAATDKTRLDGMATGAAALGSSVASIVDTAAGDAGTGITASRIDHRHQVRVGSPSALTVGAAAADGSSSSLVRADHVHAMPGLATGAANGFMVAADKTKLDGIEAGAQVVTFSRVQVALGAATSAVGFNAQRISGVADPTAAQDVATKAYTDAIAQGLDIKQSCRLVATSNVSALTGAVVIDGVTTATDRVLLTAQSAPAANGIYLTNPAGAWARAADADVSADVTAGMYTFIVEGTANADSGWALITPDPIVLGTTALTFAQVTGAGQITAGAGMVKSGNTLNVVANADASIVVAADDIKVGVLATDAQHGTRGGGTLHATVIAAGAAGFMSGADKTRLDGMTTGATNTPLASSASPNVTAAAAAVGVATTAARQDHTHQATSGTPVALTLAGTTAAGSATSLALSDHVHALPATAAPAALTVGAASSAGVAVTLPRSDHVHAMPAAGTPVALTLAGSNSAGSAATLAVSDHVHALPATAAPAALTVGAASSAGVAVTLPRSDHVHAMPGLASGAGDGFMLAADKTKLDGIATSAAALASAAPANVGTAAVVGVGTTAARADHVHSHGVITGGHVDATSGASGFMPGADKGALDAITTGATVTINALVATATTLPAYNATTISTNQPRLTATANGALTVDGIAVAANNLVLVLFESAANCGLYKVIAPGTVGTPWQLDLVLSAAYLGTYVGLFNGATIVVRTGPTGYAYCNRQFRAVSSSSGLFVEIPGPPQIWPRDTVAPTTIYPGWVYNITSLVAGANANLTLVSPPGSEQVLRGVVFGLEVETANTFTVTITPTSPSHIQPPYTAGGQWPTSATFLPVTNSLIEWVCGRGNSSYNPDSPYWKPIVYAGLAASTLSVDASTMVRLQGSAPAAGSALIATSATAMAFSAPGLPAALTVGGAQAGGVANTHARSDHAHAMPAVATPSVSGFLSAADKTALDLLVATQDAPFIVETNPGSLLYADEFAPGSSPDLATLGYTCKNASTGATMTRAGNVNFATTPALTSTQYNSTIIGSWLYLQTGALMTVTKTMSAPFGCIAVRAVPSNVVVNTSQRCGVFVADGNTYSTSKKVMAGFVDGSASTPIVGGSSQTGTGAISSTGNAPVTSNDDADVFVLSKGTVTSEWGMSIRKAIMPAVVVEFWYLTPAIADTATTFGFIVHSGNTGAGQRHVAIDYLRRYPANTFFGY